MQKPKVSFSLVLALTSSVLAIQVVVLARENRALKAAMPTEVESETPVHEPSRRAHFEQGELLEPFDLTDENGAKTRVGFDGEFERLLLFVYSRGCSACPTALPVWDELSSQLAPPVSVIGIQLDGVAADDHDDPAWNNLAFGHHGLIDPSQVPLAKMTRIPLTLLVDAAGLIQWVRYGALDEQDLGELRDLLDLE